MMTPKLSSLSLQVAEQDYMAMHISNCNHRQIDQSLVDVRRQQKGHLVSLHLCILLHRCLQGVLLSRSLCLLFKSHLQVLHKFLHNQRAGSAGVQVSNAYAGR